MGPSGNVFVKSAVILILLGALAVNGYENDDLVFDQDGRTSAIEVPLIERQQEQSFFQRVKRGVWDWFAPKPKATPPSDESEVDDQTTESYDQNVEDLFMDKLKSRNSRESGEENTVPDLIENEDNDVGNTAEGHHPLPIYPPTDDEDLGGSGDVEGSAGDDDGLWGHSGTELPVGLAGQRRFYRITLSVMEPYLKDYSDRNSRAFEELSRNLTRAIEALYREKIPEFEHSTTVVKISPLPDPFSTQVTLDVGSTFSDELEIRHILQKELENHLLGSMLVSPDGFTFRNVQVSRDPECESNELRCRDGFCIPLSQRCDGIPQCPDASDEQDCRSETTTERATTKEVDTYDDYSSSTDYDETTLSGGRTTVTTASVTGSRLKCRGDDFPVDCNDGSRRICSLQKCDGFPDCDDGSDEKGCNSSACEVGEFSCDVNRCILESKRCDFNVDCEDESDELGCSYPVCTQSEFKCRNSQCIASHLRCNGVQDCRDGSDEINCPCKDDQFECTPLYCISLDRKCDGTNDCSNGLDEKDCGSYSRCREDQFQCNDGSCVNLWARCDGHSDCRDRSDERNCTVIACTSDQFRCHDGMCVDIGRRCDGRPDCINGEDEHQCGCGQSEFRCDDGQCVLYKLQCNGVNDCKDGSDERDCVKTEMSIAGRRGMHNASQHNLRSALKTTMRRPKKWSGKSAERRRDDHLAGQKQREKHKISTSQTESKSDAEDSDVYYDESNERIYNDSVTKIVKMSSPTSVAHDNKKGNPRYTIQSPKHPNKFDEIKEMNAINNYFHKMGVKSKDPQTAVTGVPPTVDMKKDSNKFGTLTETARILKRYETEITPVTPMSKIIKANLMTLEDTHDTKADNRMDSHSEHSEEDYFDTVFVESPNINDIYEDVQYSNNDIDAQDSDTEYNSDDSNERIYNDIVRTTSETPAPTRSIRREVDDNEKVFAEARIIDDAVLLAYPDFSPNTEEYYDGFYDDYEIDEDGDKDNDENQTMPKESAETTKNPTPEQMKEGSFAKYQEWNQDVEVLPNRKLDELKENSLFKKYKKTWNVTKKLLEAVTIDGSPATGSKNGEKSYQHTTDLKVNQLSASTTAVVPATGAVKVKRYYAYMNKYTPTKPSRVEVTPRTAASGFVTIGDVEIIKELTPIPHKQEEHLMDLLLRKTKFADENNNKENEGRRKGSMDWKNYKITKKRDPYAKVKVESELYRFNKVKLPRRPDYNYIPGKIIEEPTTMLTPIKTLNHQRKLENCNTKCILFNRRQHDVQYTRVRRSEKLSSTLEKSNNSTMRVVTSNNLDIPSAGRIGDPRVAAFPEFQAVIDKVVPTSDTSEEDSPNKDWENIDFVAVHEPKRNVKIKSLSKKDNVDNADRVFAEARKVDDLNLDVDYPENEDKDFDIDLDTDDSDDSNEYVYDNFVTKTLITPPPPTNEQPRYTIKPSKHTNKPVEVKKTYAIHKYFRKWNKTTKLPKTGVSDGLPKANPNRFGTVMGAANKLEHYDIKGRKTVTLDIVNQLLKRSSQATTPITSNFETNRTVTEDSRMNNNPANSTTVETRKSSVNTTSTTHTVTEDFFADLNSNTEEYYDGFYDEDETNSKLPVDKSDEYNSVEDDDKDYQENNQWNRTLPTAIAGTSHISTSNPRNEGSFAQYHHTQSPAFVKTVSPLSLDDPKPDIDESENRKIYKPKKDSLFRKYLKNYNVTKKLPEVMTTSSPNITNSKSRDKIYRYTKELKQSDPSDVVNKILKANGLLASTISAALPTALQATPSTVSSNFVITGDVEIAKDINPVSEQNKELYAKENKGGNKKTHKGYKGRTGSIDWKNYKITKKPDPYKNVKVESELYGSKKVKLPHRPEFGNVPKKTTERTTTKVISIGTSDIDRELDNCNNECALFWKKKFVELIGNTTPKSTLTIENSIATKVEENIDSGLIDSEENCTESNSNTDLTARGSGEAESRETMSVMTKKCDRKKVTSITTIPESTTQKKGREDVGITIIDKAKPKKKNKKNKNKDKKKTNNKKNGKNGRKKNGKKGKMTTHDIRFTTEAVNEVATNQDAKTGGLNHSEESDFIPTKIVYVSTEPPVDQETTAVNFTTAITNESDYDSVLDTITKNPKEVETSQQTMQTTKKSCDRFWGCIDSDESVEEKEEIVTTTTEVSKTSTLTEKTTKKSCDFFSDCDVSNEFDEEEPEISTKITEESKTPTPTVEVTKKTCYDGWDCGVSNESDEEQPEISTKKTEEPKTQTPTVEDTEKSCNYWLGCDDSNESDEEQPEISTKTTKELKTPTPTVKATTKSCLFWWSCDGSYESDEEIPSISTKTTAEPETPTPTVKTTKKPCDSFWSCFNIDESNEEKPDLSSYEDYVTKSATPETTKVSTGAAGDRDSESLESSISREKKSGSYENSKSPRIIIDTRKENTIIWDATTLPFARTSDSDIEIDMETNISEEILRINQNQNAPERDYIEVTLKNPEYVTTEGIYSGKLWGDDSNEVESGEVTVKETSTRGYVLTPPTIFRRLTTKSSDGRCRPYQHLCDDYRCVHIWNVCDKVAHCKDGSDETNCPTLLIRLRENWDSVRCKKDQFPCDYTLCLEMENVCDGITHCVDRTDETNCDYYNDLRNDVYSDYFMRYHGRLASTRRPNGRAKRCDPDTEFECNDGMCIPDYVHCDGIAHCRNGEDEDPAACLGFAPCPSMDFTCEDGSCIPKTSVCDGIDDCPRAGDELHCERECTPTQFKCGSGGKCIEGIYRCDGHPDCPDRSDEEGCPSSSDDNVTTHNVTHTNTPPLRPWSTGRPGIEKECDPLTEMRCDDGLQCVLLRRKCDNVFDCFDNSDERDCGGCEINEWKCASGECVTENARCDGTMHCPDGSDELGCAECPAGSFRCDDGLCLDLKRRCDGRANCRDGSDELNCQTTYCSEGQLPCANGVCISEKLFCDNKADCQDGSDERNCHHPQPEPLRCRSDEYTCRDGSCIPQEAYCDGRKDCPDEDDERNCRRSIDASDKTSSGRHPESVQVFTDSTVALGGPYGVTGTESGPWSNQSAPRICTEGDFVCADGTCIPAAHRCDNFYDCRDFTDEQYCFACSRDQFQCRNGDCINNDQRCNVNIDCDDGSDEEGCEPETTPSPRHCSPDQFTCVYDRTCVHYSSRCNGIPECRDNSDEDGCEPDVREGLNLKTYPSEQIIKENPAKQGREVVFQCRDEGSLRAPVRWSRGNGLPLPPGSRDINGRLEIPNIQLEHSGTYVCEAAGYPPSTPGQKVTVHLEVEKFDIPATRPPQVCQYDEATCSNGDCIPKTAVCNGKYDCTDGSDEMRCSPHGCEPNQFTCANKECVSKVWRCDGDKDCRDGTDEENCEAPPPGSPCRYDEYQCAKYDQCIPRSYHCDMQRDCQDGSDEFGCSPVYITRPPPGMMNLHIGETMILTCTAIGVPVPEINWRLNWGHVPPKCYSTSQNGTGTLTCPDIQISDQGAYSCEALNVAGFVFAVPDTILVVQASPGVCREGTFNDEARTPEECISCFCFGHSNRCKSADLFTYQLRPPFDRFSVVSVETSPNLRIQSEISSQVAEVRPRGTNGADIYAPYNTELTSYNVPYFALPKNYYGSSTLKSYGGYLKYTVSYDGEGAPNDSPDVIISGNGFDLVHRGRPLQPGVENERQVRFFYGDWYKNRDGQNIPATREEIMMVLARVDHILIKAKYEDSPELQVAITDIVMDTADVTNAGLGAASYVEKCTCPTGYYGDSCESCAPGFQRRTSGPRLGECHLPAKICKEGFYGDPSRNIPCEPCPCPHTNPSHQHARTCHLGADLQPVCDCQPEYKGVRCELCADGYHGNPMIGRCEPDVPCDPHGSLTPYADADGKCRCKEYATGLYCDQCKANTFNLASKNQFGCISCFCMGHTDRCNPSHWYRSETRVSFTNSIRNFTLVESELQLGVVTSHARPISEGIRLDMIGREIVYSSFPNRGNTYVYYWELPSIFLGNQITSYGGDLRYTVRYVPSAGGQSSRNNAADVELISANEINLLYYSKETPEANTPQSFTVPLLEQYWQRYDGTQPGREDLLMALANVEAIRIKATYTTHTDEAALSFVSLETAEKHNTGRDRAVEVEECYCPVGYRGLSCENCEVGYTRVDKRIYLGDCEPCNCNGHSTNCDPEDGICENCANHTTGDNCELCELGYMGDPALPGGCIPIGDRNNTIDCNCDPAGSERNECINGRCYCKANVEGSRCNRCRPSTFGLSAENIDGCNECYCSGVTNQCHESSLYVQQLPMWVHDSHHGFTLTDASRLDIIDDGFEINVALNEIGYRFFDTRNRRLFWSLPAVFTGNKVKSYGGVLTITQQILAHPNSKILKDQDVLLYGNGITLFWTNPREIVPGVRLTYNVPLRESEWRRLSTAGPRGASRTDLMTVLSNLDAILVRASHSEGMTGTYISDISLDTAVDIRGSRRATQIEACRCPRGYSGTSCETCAHGYYRDISNRSVSFLGSCNPCPCNDHEESCEIGRSGQVQCNCLSGYGGQYCQSIAELRVGLMPIKVQAPRNTIVNFTCSYDHGDTLYIYFKLSQHYGLPLTAWSLVPGPLVATSHGAHRVWSVYVGTNPCSVECLVVDRQGKELARIATTLSPVDYPPPPPTVPPPVDPYPKIIVSIQEKKLQIVQIGSTVRLHCNGTSVDNAPLRIQWEKEGTSLPVTASDDYRGLLIIRDIRLSDSGIYVCRVTDGINVVLDKVSIAVGDAAPEAPRAVILPAFQQVVAGQLVEFRCTATGNPEPDIEWVRVQGRMNPDARLYKGSLTIPIVRESDAAEYKCVARNNIGADAPIAVLRVSPDPYNHTYQNVPPTINPSQWTGSTGDTVRLICAPSPYHENVLWIRSSNLPLPESSSQRDGVLTIVNPVPIDSGIYICTATNYQGAQTSNSANITIYPRRTQPSVRVEPERQTVSQGTEALVKCIADRESGLHIKWVKHGEPSLGPNARQVGDTLRIISPKVSDRGIYICRASNAAGSYEASAIIEVRPRETPVLELHPKTSQIVNLGSSADIQCRVIAGVPVPEVNWSRDDNRPLPSNIQQLPGGLLRLTNVTEYDGVAYRCSASNTVGSTSAIARIEVQSLPVITITPTGGLIYAKRGARVTLICSAQGIPQPTVAWMKSHPGGSIYSFLRGRNASRLTAVHEIASMSDDDEDSYTCQAINAAGTTEDRVQVRLEEDNRVDDNDYYPPGPSRPGQDVNVSIPDDNLSIATGGTITIRCLVHGPSNGPRIDTIWERSDRRPLPEGSSVRDGSLTISNVTPEAAGEYVCLALDPSGAEVFRARASLNVISFPKIVLNPTRQTVRPGESPAIICTATGDEPMTIEWEAISRPLPRSVSKDRGVLRFHRITNTDAGKYVCKATNNAGTAEAVAEVLVSENTIDDPIIRAVNRDITTYAGSTVTLRCDVRPGVTVHWSKDGRPLSRNARVGVDYIELTHVQSEDGGTYTCQVRDVHGDLSDYINLRVEVYQTVQCGQGRYLCRSQECISLDKICDGYIHCHDATDERFCRIPRYLQYLHRRREAANSAVAIVPSQDVVNIGDTIDLHCTYTGTHNPVYHWSRPNHISLPRNAHDGGYVLRISNVELTENGVYRCHADTEEGSYDGDYNLIVQAGPNDAPAIETKNVPYGKDLEMSCRVNSDKPVKFQWSKLGDLLPRDAQTYDNKLKLTNVKAEDAGTYICTASNGIESTEDPTVLVVTGIVPNFSQAPESWISLPPLSDVQFKLNMEVSFKPASYDGIILYNDENPDGIGDFIMLSLVRGYPEFKFDMGSGAAVIRSQKPVKLGEWHTIKLIRSNKEGTMLVDGEGPYKAVNTGKKQSLDLKEPLYIGGVPDYKAVNPQADANTGFVGCISTLVIGDRTIDLMGEQTDSHGITTCETCAEDPCHNSGVCQEAPTKNGYRCLCPAGYSGKHCDFIGQSCYPGACGDGKCVDKDRGFECYCPHGTSGARCELFTPSLNVPAFRDDRAFVAYPTPGGRRHKLSMNFKPSDNGDGILLYCSQSEEGLGDFLALVIKDRHVEFRFDVGSGMAVIRSNHIVQPGTWTHVTLSREWRNGRLSVNGEQTVEGRSPGTSRSMTLTTPLYLGGIDRRRITVNRNIGVDRNFHGCINDMEMSTKYFDFLKSIIDSANVEDCSTIPIKNGTQTEVTTQQPTTPPTTNYDPCERRPCIHGECQIVGEFDYSCTCDYGYVGRDCEKILKQCELLKPCQNDGSCMDLHGSYKCDCQLGFTGKDCEKRVEILYDVAFKGDGWLELDRSVMTHEEEFEVLCFEISTNKSNGLVMWHGQTPNDLTTDDYIALAVVDGYVEFQYNLGSGPAVIRVTAYRIDDGERHRIVLKRQRSEGNIELDGEYMETGISDGLQQLLNVRGSVYLGGVPDWAMAYGRYHDGFSGCIYAMEVQDSGTAVDIGAKAIRGKNVAPCTRARWIPSSLIFTDVDSDGFDDFVPPPPVNIIHPKPTANLAPTNIRSIYLLVAVHHTIGLTIDVKLHSIFRTMMCFALVTLTRSYFD